MKETWHTKEIIRSIYDITDPETAETFVCELAIHLQDQTRPPEGRTLARWFDQITNWHKADVTNGPTEAINT